MAICNKLWPSPSAVSISGTSAGVIRADAHQAITNSYSALQSSLEDGGPVPDGLLLRSADLCWSCKQPLTAEAKHCDECGATARTTETHKLRYFIFVCFEIKKFQQAGILPLSAADACLMESNEHIAALRRYLDRERIPMVEVAEPSASRSATAPPRQPRRNLLEILLDPRNIQMLLGVRRRPDGRGAGHLAVGQRVLHAARGRARPGRRQRRLAWRPAGGCCGRRATNWPAGPSRSSPASSCRSICGTTTRTNSSRSTAISGWRPWSSASSTPLRPWCCATKSSSTSSPPA